MAIIIILGKIWCIFTFLQNSRKSIYRLLKTVNILMFVCARISQKLWVTRWWFGEWINVSGLFILDFNEISNTPDQSWQNAHITRAGKHENSINFKVPAPRAIRPKNTARGFVNMPLLWILSPFNLNLQMMQDFESPSITFWREKFYKPQIQRGQLKLRAFHTHRIGDSTIIRFLKNSTINYLNNRIFEVDFTMRTLFPFFFNRLLKRERFSTLQFYLPLPHMFKKNTTLKSNRDMPFKANVKLHIFGLCFNSLTCFSLFYDYNNSLTIGRHFN